MDMKSHNARRAAAWSEKGGWNALYADAYRYAIPFRQSVGRTTAARIEGEIFDMTAPVGVMRFAGQLHQDMFPPGEAFFVLSPGALAARVFKARKENRDLDTYARHLEDLSEEVQPHFATGEFDLAIAEMCVDLAAGTGVLLPSPGHMANGPFVRFSTLPFEETALQSGGYGDVTALFWSTLQSYEAIKAQFPRAQFCDDFNKKLADSPYERTELHQDFVQDRDGRWSLTVTCKEQTETPVFRENYKTRPFASPRYTKTPGEVYGRGPLLMSLGAIRTLNRVVELQLKASALQMLGIWGYRPSSQSNPDTWRMAPGAFWPMQSTGGVMGPDVQRLDTGGRELQVAGIVQDELRTQIRAALHDDTLPNGGATPKSATEIMHRVAQLKTNYLGSFGRLVHETVPHIVPRVMEILKDKRVLSTPITIDDFITRVAVTSPLATALRADALKSIMEYVQVRAQLKGPQSLARDMHLDAMLDQMGVDMGIARKWLTTENERAQYDAAAAQQAAMATLAESAAADPKGMVEAMQMADDPAAAGRPSLKLVS